MVVRSVKRGQNKWIWIGTGEFLVMHSMGF